jgi:hypothetical protein
VIAAAAEIKPLRMETSEITEVVKEGGGGGCSIIPEEDVSFLLY